MWQIKKNMFSFIHRMMLASVFAGYICSSADLLVWGLVIEKYYVDELVLQKGGRVKFHFSGFWITVWVSLFSFLNQSLSFIFQTWNRTWVSFFGFLHNLLFGSKTSWERKSYLPFCHLMLSKVQIYISLYTFTPLDASVACDLIV